MTYFLDQPKPPEPVTGQPPVPSFLDGIAAVFNKELLDSNVNFRALRETNMTRYDRAKTAWERLGKPNDFPNFPMPDQNIDLYLPSRGLQDEIIARAQKAAATEPDKWKDLDLSEEGIAAEVDRRLQAENEDLKQTIAMRPDATPITDFFVRSAAALTDVRNLPFLFAGGGEGALLKVAAREGAWNAAAEAVTFKDRQDMAKRLNEPEPDFMATMRDAFVTGGLFGLGTEAIVRGARYWSNWKTPQMEGIDNAVAEALTARAETAIARGENPMQAVTEALNRPAEAPSPSQAADPLIPPEITVTPLPDAAGKPLEPDTIKAVAEQGIAISEGRKEAARQQYDRVLQDMEDQYARDFSFEASRKYPLGEVVRRMGGVRYYDILPDGTKTISPAASELRNMGVTPKTHPWLYSKKGRSSFDDLVASEMDGLGEVLPVDPVTGYMEQWPFIEALGRELTGGPKQPLSAASAIARDAIDAHVQRGPYEGLSPAQDFVDGKRSPEGFFVDLTAYGADAEKVRSDFNQWLDSNRDMELDPEVYQEVLHELQTRGGDADFLIERAGERTLDGAERELARAEGRTDDLGGSAAGSGGQGTSPAGPSQAGPEDAGRGAAGGAQYASSASESTAAGQQALIPGVAPITERQRLEAAQSARMGGDPRGPDSQIGGLFDPGDKVRSDLFDSPDNAAATAYMDSMVNDLRAEVDAGDDLTVGFTEDGNPITMSDVLDEIDEMDALAREIEACRSGVNDTGEVPF